MTKEEEAREDEGEEGEEEEEEAEEEWVVYDPPKKSFMSWAFGPLVYRVVRRALLSPKHMRDAWRTHDVACRLIGDGATHLDEALVMARDDPRGARGRAVFPGCAHFFSHLARSRRSAAERGGVALREERDARDGERRGRPLRRQPRARALTGRRGHRRVGDVGRRRRNFFKRRSHNNISS